jgi:hypothetical protein
LAVPDFHQIVYKAPRGTPEATMKHTLPLLLTFLFPLAFPLSSLSFTYAFLYKTCDTGEPQAVDYSSVSVKLSSDGRIKIFLKLV